MTTTTLNLLSPYKPIGPSVLILVMMFSFSFYSKLEVFLLSFYSKLGSLFLNRTLLGGMESLRSESGISAFGISI